MNKHMHLYHYFEKETGPFVSLSDLSDDEAQKIIDNLICENKTLAAKTHGGDYMFYRRLIENKAHSLFIKKGGKPIRQTPYYMVWGECQHLKSWYKCGEYIEIPIEEFDMNSISFTYGDTFITYDPSHGKTEEYRQCVYTYDEILEIIKKYGWPQESWNQDAPWWQPTYIEAQVWSDIAIDKYKLLYDINLNKL